MSDTPQKPRRSITRRLFGGVSMVFFLLLVVGALLILSAIDRPLPAPDWVRQRIEARLAQDVPQAHISFGEMTIGLSRSLRPHVELRNVRVQSPDGIEILALSEVNADLSKVALIEGRLAPRTVTVSGVVATLERDVDGAISLHGGFGANAPAQTAPNFAALARQLDELMTVPATAFLRQAELRALTLRYQDRRANRVWTVDGGRLIAIREDSDLSLSADLAVLAGGAGVATLNATYNSTIGEPEARFSLTIDGLPAQDIATQSPAFAWLDILRAPISGAVRSGLKTDGTLAPLHATLQIGKGAVQPNAGTKPIPFEAVRSYFTYDRTRAMLRFDELSVQSKWVSGSAEGTASLEGLETGRLDALIGQFRLTGLRANPQELYPEPIAINGAEMDFQLSFNPFRARLGRLQISDGDTLVQADGRLFADPEGWRFGVDARLNQIAPARILQLWPEKVKPKTRGWLVKNLLAGSISDGDFALRGDPGEKLRTFLSFEFHDASVRFMKSMPALTGGRGHASLDADRFVLSIDDGAVTAEQGGDLRLAGSSFIVPDVRVKDGSPAVVRMRIASSVQAALWALDRDPINALSRAGLPIDIARGKARLEGTLAIPLKKGMKADEVIFNASGLVAEATSDTLIKGRRLRSPRLRVVADNKNISITGEGTLDDVAFEGSFSQQIGKGAAPGEVTGVVDISPSGLDRFGVSLPPGTLSGAGKGRITLRLLRGGHPDFTLTSSLEGLRLSVPQINWTKPAKTRGDFRISGKLGGTAPQVDALSLSAPGLSAAGRLKLVSGGGFERLSLDSVVVGNWLSAAVDLISRGAGRAPKLVLRGGRLDMRKASFGSSTGGGGGAGGSAPIEVTLDRLQITDTIALTGLRGNFSTTKGLDGRFNARVNGGAQVSGRVSPRNGRSAVRLTSPDAGGVFRSAQVIQQAAGGAMDLVLLPVGSGGAFDGRLSVRDTRIKDAPSMAALLNAVSVVGLLDQMNGDGIRFDEITADFRLTPGRMTLTNGSATGASMGISMDGVYATETGQIAMQGVISPVYLLNGIGSVVSRKGEGLIGFNYALSGQAKSPKVSINPLSALAPGPLRNIFRGPQTELPDVEGTKNSTLPNPAPQPTRKRPIDRAYEGR